MAGTAASELKNRQLMIPLRKGSPVVLFVLTFFLLGCWLVPISMLLTLAMGWAQLHIETLVFALVCLAVAVYLTRLLLWNFYGREILRLEKEELVYLAHYRLFKELITQIPLKDLNLFPEATGKKSVKERLVLLSGDTRFPLIREFSPVE